MVNPAPIWCCAHGRESERSSCENVLFLSSGQEGVHTAKEETETICQLFRVNRLFYSQSTEMSAVGGSEREGLCLLPGEQRHRSHVFFTLSCHY